MVSKHQKGSMMIEIVAVVALLALLTPLLFRQIQRRTDEIDNVRIASAMRNAKDALQRAIEDNVTDLKAHLHDNQCDTVDNLHAAFDSDHKPEDYAATGIDLGDFELYVCRNEIETDKNVFWGIVVDTTDDDLSFLAAADIATMIGAEGGVCVSTNHATGVRNGWEMNMSGFACDQDLVVAITSLVGATDFDGVTSVTANDFISPTGTVQVDAAYFEDFVHMDGDLSIGDTLGNCVTGEYDSSYAKMAGCQPVFEVALTDEAGTQGEVRLRNAKIIFANDDGKKYPNPNVDNDIPNQGTSGVRARQDGGQANPDSGYTTSDTIQYAVDAKGESVMKDIRLLSRGNAKLSDLLPNYVLKGVLFSTKAGSGEQAVTDDVWNWSCPPYHRKAIIVEGCGKGILTLSGGVTRCAGAESDDNTFRVYQYCIYKKSAGDTSEPI